MLLCRINILLLHFNDNEIVILVVQALKISSLISVLSKTVQKLFMYQTKARITIPSQLNCFVATWQITNLQYINKETHFSNPKWRNTETCTCHSKLPVQLFSVLLLYFTLSWLMSQ